MTSMVKVAIVQAAAIPLAIGDGIEALLGHAARAVDSGAKVIAFGETFLGGYPIWLDEAPGAALWDQPGTKALHAILLEQAVRANDPRLEPLQTLVDTAGVILSFGAHERVRSSLANTQFILRPNQPPLPHRKLVPTHGERLIWARGDGSTLGVHQAEWGAVGQLICWEHWMPLARAAMHHAGEAIHIAAWPTVRAVHDLASRHYAFEGNCFVLAAGTVMHRADLLDGLARAGGDAAAEALLRTIPDGQLQFGGSAIIAPNASVLAQAEDGEELIIAEADLRMIGRELAALDSDGHYARPDVFELRINRRATPGIINEGGLANG